MEPLSIQIDNIGKRYKLGVRDKPYATLRDTITGVLTSPIRRWRTLGEQSTGDDQFWALRNVDLRVERGEVVGIIGRNGAGKSTLLKILSRITEPTEGRAVVTGRVGSLLEIGTGFHQELSGRENIYLNGAILGMKKAEIDRKFDEIVAFAEVEKFLDTPVKRYSSGMYVRLAFAVAAHLEPEILLIDEVLAVGDAQFQKKCLRSMGDMHRGGRTVLFVSHNMAAIENLCPRVIWIDKGGIRMDGPARDVIREYITSAADTRQESYELANFEPREGSGDIRFTKMEFLDRNDAPKELVCCGDALKIRLHFESRRRLPDPHFSLHVHTDLGTLVSIIDTWTMGFNVSVLEPGPGHIDLEIDFLNLRPDRYYLSLWAGGLSAKYDHLDRCAVLDVGDADFFGSGRKIESRYGIIFFDSRWTFGGSVS